MKELRWNLYCWWKAVYIIQNICIVARPPEKGFSRINQINLVVGRHPEAEVKWDTWIWLEKKRKWLLAQKTIISNFQRTSGMSVSAISLKSVSTPDKHLWIEPKNCDYHKITRETFYLCWILTDPSIVNVRDNEHGGRTLFDATFYFLKIISQVNVNCYHSFG